MKLQSASLRTILEHWDSYDPHHPTIFYDIYC